MVTRLGCRRRASLRRVSASRERPREPTRCFGIGHVHAASNVANPRSGIELQYARGPAHEQAVEVVRDHEDGARMRRGSPIPTEHRLRSALWERRAGVGETEEGHGALPLVPQGEEGPR